MQLFDFHKGRILVTGAAGFIGANVCRNLLEIGCNVIEVDNLNTYYDVGLKRHRLTMLNNTPVSNYGKLIWLKKPMCATCLRSVSLSW